MKKRKNKTNKRTEDEGLMNNMKRSLMSQEERRKNILRND